MLEIRLKPLSLLFLFALLNAYDVLCQIEPPFPMFVDRTSALTPDIPDVQASSIAWADYDNDNDLDFILTGISLKSGDIEYISQIWRNGTTGNSGVFTNQTAFVAPGLPKFALGYVVWGDYDNDNDLDILLTSQLTDGTEDICEIWINDVANSGVFTRAETNLPDLIYANAAWTDYDNDGDLDILTLGVDDMEFITKLWRNDGNNTFTEIQTDFPGLAARPSIGFGDYDNDGDQDIALLGMTYPNSELLPYAEIWKNDDGNFTAITSGITPANGGSIDWGDYDSDGDLDLLLFGFNGTEAFCEVWRNDNGVFLKVQTGFPPIGTSAQWADFDNDGDLDILLSGHQESTTERGTMIWKNSNATFSDAGFQTDSNGSVHSGDFDNDHDLDILIAALQESQLYSNESTIPNEAPGQPASLISEVTGPSVTLSWSAANDDHTPVAALTYNIRVGTSPGSSEVVSAKANVSTGYRYLPQKGNAELCKHFKLTGLQPGTYYWSVQAIDNNYEGGIFAPEQSFIIVSDDPDVTVPAVVSTNPTHSSTDISTDAPLQLTFSENIVLGTGSVRLFDASTNIEISVLALTPSNTTIAGAQATIVLSELLPANTSLYVKVDHGSFKDITGNSFQGITDASWSFVTSSSPDTQAPLLTSTDPESKATDLSTDISLKLIFSENVVLGSGSVRIFNASTDVEVSAFVLSSSNTAIEGAIATITLPVLLPASTTLYVKIDNGSFEDMTGNTFTGIQDRSWSFSTAGISGSSDDDPVIVSTFPANLSTGVDPQSEIAITFSKPIMMASGQLKIIYFENGFTVIQTIKLNSLNTTIEGNIVAIRPDQPLSSGKKMYILISAGSFKDTDDREFAGISSPGFWTFTTAMEQDIIGPVLVSTVPANGDMDIDLNTTLTLRFNEYVKLNEGVVTVFLDSPDRQLLEFKLESSNTVVDKTTVIITLPQGLPDNEHVYVQLAPSAISDTIGNNFQGITDKRWKFSTQKLVTGIEDNTALGDLTIHNEGNQIIITLENSHVTIQSISDMIGRQINFIARNNNIVFEKPRGLLIIHGKKSDKPYALKLSLEDF